MKPNASTRRPLDLTDAQFDAWHRDGFLVHERFVDDEPLSELRQAYEDILAGLVSAQGDRRLGDITRQVMNPSEAHPVFDANPVVETALYVAGQLLGTADVVRDFDMLIYKPPGHPHETPWHQDMAYAAMPFAEPGTPIQLGSVQFWIPLDNVDTENGCMQFIPGYHHKSLLEHYVASGSPEDEGRLLALVDPESQLDLSQAVVAEIPAGGVTMHGYGTPHYTGPNRSTDRQRRSYIFTVSAPAVNPPMSAG